jgi:hypothetical protein
MTRMGMISPSRLRLSKDINGIAFELAIGSHQMRLFRFCLGNEQSVKGIIHL